MTTSNELIKFMIDNESNIKDGLEFLGVFASDELPRLNKKQLSKGVTCIFNYDPSYKNGSHWVCARILPNKKAYWFDSYGLPPDDRSELSDLRDKTNFKKWLEDYSHQMYWNNYDLQSLETEVCGLYSCYACIHGTTQENPGAWTKFHLTPSIKFNCNPVDGCRPMHSRYDIFKRSNDDIIKQLIPIKIS